MWVFGYGSLMWDGWEQTLGGVRVERAELTLRGTDAASISKELGNIGSACTDTWT